MRRLPIFGIAAAVLAVTAPAWAQSTCTASEQFTLNWNTQTQGAQGTGTQNYGAADGLGHSEVVTVSYNGDIGAFQPVAFGGAIGTITTPYIGVVNTGGVAATDSTLTLGTIFSAFQTNIDSATNSIGIRFTFSKPVREIRFTMLDIDYTANQFRDWIKVTGISPTAGTVTPLLSSPYGSNNNQTNPGQTAPATSVIGPYTSTVPNFSASESVGNTGNSTNIQDYGNITASFAQPVTQVDIRYANGPSAYMTGTPGQQAISIHKLFFCTMPQLAMAKTVTPWSNPITGTVNPKMIPGGDVIYTLTVTNNGGSPVDLSTTVLTDPIASNLIFYNGDIDDAGPLTTNYDFSSATSGLSFSAASLTYSNNGGATYAYAPTAGYDSAVNALRFAPTGSMAANSSFTLKFRARIK